MRRRAAPFSPPGTIRGWSPTASEDRASRWCRLRAGSGRTAPGRPRGPRRTVPAPASHTRAARRPPGSSRKARRPWPRGRRGWSATACGPPGPADHPPGSGLRRPGRPWRRSGQSPAARGSPQHRPSGPGLPARGRAGAAGARSPRTRRPRTILAPGSKLRPHPLGLTLADAAGERPARRFIVGRPCARHYLDISE